MRGARRRMIADPAPPPPSPIPTGKGSRSAANEPFSRFLDRSLRVPALSLPGGANSPRSHDCHAPAMADLRSLLSPEGDGSLDRVIGSGREFGLFRVAGHGVSVEELVGLIDESEDRGADWSDGSGLGERFCWLIGSRVDGSGRRDIGDGKFRGMSENMKIVASKLEEIAEQLSRIMLENAQKQSNHKMKFAGSKECVLSLYRFNHKNSLEQNQLPINDEIENELSDQTFLSLHIPLEHCQIYVQSEGDHFSFDANPETLIVTIGKHIQESSEREFKCVSGKMIFVPAPYIRASWDYSFSIELKLSSKNSSNILLDRNLKPIISIFDQVVFAIMVTLIYKMYIFLTS